MKLLVSLLLLAAFPSAIFAAEQGTTNDRLPAIFAGAQPVASKDAHSYKKAAVNPTVTAARQDLLQTFDMHCPQCVRNLKSNILLMHPKLKQRLPDEAFTYAECLKRLPYASEETFNNAVRNLINLHLKFHISQTRMEEICNFYRYTPTALCAKHSKTFKKEKNKTNPMEKSHENHA